MSLNTTLFLTFHISESIVWRLLSDNLKIEPQVNIIELLIEPATQQNLKHDWVNAPGAPNQDWNENWGNISLRNIGSIRFNKLYSGRSRSDPWSTDSRTLNAKNTALKPYSRIFRTYPLIYTERATINMCVLKIWVPIRYITKLSDAKSCFCLPTGSLTMITFWQFW